MNQKRVLVLGGILMVLLVLAWASGFFSGVASTVETPDIAIETGGIEKITIQKDGERLVVVRQEGDSWELVEPLAAPVDTSTRGRLFDQLDELEIESLVSSNPERHARFQVDAEQATYVHFEGGADVELYVGKTGPDFQSRYVRMGGDDRVFLATGVPLPQTELDQWRDKTVWSHPAEAIEAVAVTTPEGSYRLARSDSGWVVELDENIVAADSASVDRYLRRVASVAVDGFLMGEQASAVIDSMSHSVQVQLVDASTADLQLHERASDAAGLASGIEGVVKVSKFRVASLAPEAEELLPSQ